ncbi:hypothetical protein HOLleu_00890 [Holothuria leucospilota]|uniref:Uncharacterized protein n=1 Tax=Holothuria leucospilota TaxID=206669 RepID=A0A9Q1HG39_HOLLE|nr:hypothetical protein HOLleu_00890 [Holothuria leucospilota]
MRSIRSCMANFAVTLRVMNRLKEFRIVRTRRGSRAGIQRRIKQTKAPNYSFAYGFSSNVNSLQGKFIHLEQIVKTMSNLCFMALQGNKLKTIGDERKDENGQYQVADEALQISNFYMHRLDRDYLANGGGLITYVSKGWTVTVQSPEGVTKKRNSSHVKKFESGGEVTPQEESSERGSKSEASGGIADDVGIKQSRRVGTHKMPSRFKDFVIDTK